MWVADDVFKMPLNGVYPAFEVQTVLNIVTVVGVVDGCVDVVLDVIVADGLVEDLVAMF